VSQAAIETDRLSRQFGRLWALRDVTLTVPPGRVVALLGPNGAGKTTLLRLLLGLLEPTSGTSKVLGAPSRSLPAEVSCRIASIVDGHEPPRWATLKGLMDLQASAAPEFDRDLARHFVVDRGMSPKDRYGALSKGQKRWALTGIALAGNADVLLLDEPADGLDPAAREEFYGRLRDHATEREAAVLVATHIIGDIERVADDVALIDRGGIILSASLEDLRERVREVELPADVAIADLGEGIDVIAGKSDSDGRVVWLRCDKPVDDSLRKRLGDQALIRTVGLESLYLVLTREQTKSRVESPEEVECV